MACAMPRKYFDKINGESESRCACGEPQFHQKKSAAAESNDKVLPAKYPTKHGRRRILSQLPPRPAWKNLNAVPIESVPWRSPPSQNCLDPKGVTP